MDSCHPFHYLEFDQLFGCFAFVVAKQRFGLLVVPQYFEIQALDLGLAAENMAQLE
jgi:hypothetical protein